MWRRKIVCQIKLVCLVKLQSDVGTCTVTVADPDLELRRGRGRVGGRFLFWVTHRLFFLLWFFSFLPRMRRGRPPQTPPLGRERGRYGSLERPISIDAVVRALASHPVPYMGWVCCWFSSCSEFFSSVFSAFTPTTKTNTQNFSSTSRTRMKTS